MKYDWLVVGAGLFGASFARKMTDAGQRVLVVEKRPHVAGNIYTEDVGGIQVHRYGAHIFHTSARAVWDFVQRFADFNRFTNEPLALFRGEMYHMPFNMNTFHEMWGVTKPSEAREIIERQRAEIDHEPQNLEEQAISLVGRDLYEKLVKGYTEKQWGRDCRELPAFIIRRLPVRFVYNNNYFNDAFQGIPLGGYTRMVERMLEGIEVRCGVDYLAEKEALRLLADRVLYTGPIDAYFDFACGPLGWRSLRFETEDLPVDDFQGNAVFNYTAREVPYTRVIEHKHFEPENTAGAGHTVVTHEYPADWQPGDEPYYPMNDAKNAELLRAYQSLAEKEDGVLFGGRLGSYRYLDMDDTILAALQLCGSLLAGGEERP